MPLSGRFDTRGAATLAASACADPGGPGPALVYRFDAAASGRIIVHVSSAADLGLSAWDSCGGTELGCVDLLGGEETLEIPISPGTPVLVAVSGHRPSDSGPFALESSFEPGVCGNGVLDGDEACDDGNATGQDGCSATCSLEACDAPPLLTVDVPVAAELGGPSLLRTACANPRSGPEAVYAFVAPARATYRATLTPSGALDPVLAVRGACASRAFEQCTDDGFGGGVESALLSLDAGDLRYLVVEGWGVPDVGAYSLEVTRDE